MIVFSVLCRVGTPGCHSFLSLILSCHHLGWQGGCFSNPLFYTGMLPHAPEHKKSCKALTLLQLNLKNPSAFHSDPISLHGGRGKILSSANGRENRAVNSWCSLKMGCTGECKGPLLFCIHLMYPCWGAMSSCAQVSILILSFMLQEVWGSGSSTRCSSKPVKFPLVSELYRATKHCNILSVCIHPWYLLVKLMPTHSPLPCGTACTCAFTLFHGLASFLNTITELE